MADGPSAGDTAWARRISDRGSGDGCFGDGNKNGTGPDAPDADKFDFGITGEVRLLVGLRSGDELPP